MANTVSVRPARSGPTAFFLLAGAALLAITCLASPGHADSDPEGTWTLLQDDASWTRRAGLQVLEHRNVLYLMGGRTARPPVYPPIPGDSDIWGDVWKSVDDGETWTRILETDDENHWPARAYFEAVKKGGSMYVLGGQNFKVVPNPDCPPPYINCFAYLPDSDFFNDVWRSENGVDWTRLTADAGWGPRAGLSAVVFRNAIYVMGGSLEDDPVFGGDRTYYNDVWKSSNGRDWVQMTDSAPWAPRAGAAVVVKNGYIYLLGGEAGFFCQPQPCDPPYFNDVWRTRNGADWELVTDAAEWSARPGHKCAVVRDRIYCFGGFGLPTNPMDVWESRHGVDWEQISSSPWNATTPDEIKYDFDVVVKRSGSRNSIFTFGGDRETFDFMDPLNYLRLDNDVWRYDPPLNRSGWSDEQAPAGSPSLEAAGSGRPGLGLSSSPTVFRASTQLTYDVPEAGAVAVAIYDVSGRQVRDFGTATHAAGTYQVQWDGRDGRNRSVAAGAYFAAVRFGSSIQTVKLIRLD